MMKILKVDLKLGLSNDKIIIQNLRTQQHYLGRVTGKPT